MRLPRVRFTVRRLMVAVAIVGLLMGTGLWAVRMRTLSAAYRERAFEFGGEPAVGRNLDFKVITEDGEYISVHKDENYWLRREWGHKLAEKYRRLADRPWLPVEPDPPPPERLAHPRRAADCPKELRSRGPSCRWYVEPVYPWWTFLWTWRNQERRWYPVEPRWSFP
jgi:hypothetical protein